jgi:hypothetical protein
MTNSRDEYKLEELWIPQFLAKEVAEKVFFTGSAINMLLKMRKQEGSVDLTPLEKDEVQNLESLFQKLIQGQENDHEKPFLPIDFETVIDSVRSLVTEKIWKMLVLKMDFFGHIYSLRDYMLMYKGDLFDCFVRDAQILLRPPPVNKEKDKSTKLAEDGNFFTTNIGRCKFNISTSRHPSSTFNRTRRKFQSY